MLKILLILSLLIIITISGCTSSTTVPIAEEIIQDNSEKIQEDLEVYGLEMDCNYLSQETNDFWQVVVHDPYKDETIRPMTYCVVYALVNKNTKEIDYLYFGILCPDAELDNKCKNFNCISYSTFSYTEDDYTEITNQECDAENPCSEGLECFSFPDIGLRCSELDPCSYYGCPPWTNCVIAESYPDQVNCMFDYIS